MFFSDSRQQQKYLPEPTKYLPNSFSDRVTLLPNLGVLDSTCGVFS
jgi:hypothetical protein